MRWRLASTAVIVLAGTVVAAASAQTAVSGHVWIQRTHAMPNHPGQAYLDLHTRFSSIESTCFAFTFSAYHPLEPGESLRITPTTWLQANPFDRGPGFTNGTGAPQYSRTLCSVNYPGLPVDRLLAELIDGTEQLALNADDGLVVVTAVDVTITGTT